MSRHSIAIILITFLASATLSRADEPAIRVLVNGHAIPVNVIESNGTVYVPIDAISKALGADVRIERGEVRVERPEPLAPVVLAATPMAPSIKGRLTWYNNVWEPRKPDVGAQAWLLNDSQVRDLARAAGGTIAEPIPKNQPGWDVKLTEPFQFPHTVADEDGRFSFINVAAGPYLLVAKSVRANGLAARDRNGKIRFYRIQVATGGTVDASIDFGPTAYRD
ncbi:MAG TPA: hypothetical protein VNL17_13520 [Verrucomicrobiae bacterium]|nr:hypothetical protein [Verrucomicrobiae bacterium]